MTKHRGEPRRCTMCGHPEGSHDYRHWFTHPAYALGALRHPNHRAPLPIYYTPRPESDRLVRWDRG